MTKKAVSAAKCNGLRTEGGGRRHDNQVIEEEGSHTQEGLEAEQLQKSREAGDLPRPGKPTHLCNLRNSMKILFRLYFIFP